MCDELMINQDSSHLEFCQEVLNGGLQMGKYTTFLPLYFNSETLGIWTFWLTELSSAMVILDFSEEDQ